MGKYSNKRQDRQDRETLKRLLERLFPFHDFRWRDRGHYSIGLCPWHDDHHPSLSVYDVGPASARYLCHACGKTGDADTIRSLLAESGEIEVNEETKARLQKAKARAKLAPQLWQAGLVLQDYLLEEGCPWLDGKVPGWRAVIEQAQEEGIPVVGLYPSREELGKALKEKGISLEALEPYLWPVRAKDGRPWDLEGWLAWFQGRPGEVCRVRVRRPGAKERAVMEALLRGGLVGLQVWPRRGIRPLDATLVEGETDWLALQARHLADGGERFVPGVALGGVSNVRQAVRELAAWVEVEDPRGALLYWPDYDRIERGRSPGLWAGLGFAEACVKEGVWCKIVFSQFYRPGQDPCDYLKEYKVVKDDLIPPREFVQRLIEEYTAQVPELDRQARRSWLEEKLRREFPHLSQAKQENTSDVSFVEYLSPPPPVRYNHIWPAGKVAVLAGFGGAGKSYLSLWSAIEFARTQEDYVLLWNIEDGRDEMHRRFRRIFDHLDISELERPSVAARITHRTARPTPFWSREGGRSRINVSLLNVLRDAIEQGYKLIFLDPVLSFFGEDENHNDLIRLFLDHLNEVVQGTDASLVLVAHTRKGGSKDTAAVEKVRGGGAWTDAARFVCLLEKGELKVVKTNILPRLREEDPQGIGFEKVYDGDLISYVISNLPYYYASKQKMKVL